MKNIDTTLGISPASFCFFGITFDPGMLKMLKTPHLKAKNTQGFYSISLTSGLMCSGMNTCKFFS